MHPKEQVPGGQPPGAGSISPTPQLRFGWGPSPLRALAQAQPPSCLGSQGAGWPRRGGRGVEGAPASGPPVGPQEQAMALAGNTGVALI